MVMRRTRIDRERKANDLIRNPTICQDESVLPCLAYCLSIVVEREVYSKKQETMAAGKMASTSSC